MDTCPACGQDVEPVGGHCPECGARMEGATESFEIISEGPSGLYGLDLVGTDVPLLVVRKGSEMGERFYLEGAEMTVGRDPDSHIFLNDVTVSRHHAVLRVTDEGVVVEDAGSLNGTYVNDQRVDRAELSSGDTLQIGRFQMLFLSGGGA